jgi:hypothetical protein
MDSRDAERRARDRIPRGLVPLSEAVLTACFQTGMSGAISKLKADAMVSILAQRCTVYLVSKDKTVRALTSEELTKGTLVEGGRCMVFADGRERLQRLMVTRSALRAAIAAIRRSAVE